MEIKVNVKENFKDGLSFLRFLKKKDSWDEYVQGIDTDIKDLDYLDGQSLKKDDPKVIQMKEIFEPKIFNKMKEYFVKTEKDFTKKNIRSYISDYNKLYRKPVIPFYYFFTDDDLENLVIEWFENDLGELLLPKTIKDGIWKFPFQYMDIFNNFINDFRDEMLSSDINTITKKLIRLC